MLEDLKDLRLKDVKKALVAVATLAAQLLTLGLIPEQAQGYVVAGLAVLNSIGVYAVRNGDREEFDFEPDEDPLDADGLEYVLDPRPDEG